ncbi:Hypothetical protein AA314_05947 [Archangium gephyra]|uniref:Uncharacterized protein n=1 Tax=Archangium gephyra TaxID=48 RepID=A0AAC8TH92_9BACT|nr:Hypothetical protein AA314_05947 [Archangium gephyra]
MRRARGGLGGTTRDGQPRPREQEEKRLRHPLWQENPPRKRRGAACTKGLTVNSVFA